MIGIGSGRFRPNIKKNWNAWILLDQFWAKQWMIQPAFCPSARQLLHQLARKKNPCAPFYKVYRA